MISFLGFLTLFYPGVKFFLFRKRGPVDPLHLHVFRVALPVSTGQGKQLERLQFARMRHMRAQTKINERRIIYVINACRVRNLFVNQLAF